MPTREKLIYRISIEASHFINRKNRSNDASLISQEKFYFLFPAKHFITADDEVKKAIESIKLELEERLAEFEKRWQTSRADDLNAYEYDLAMIREIGYTNGIENFLAIFWKAGWRTAGTHCSHTFPTSLRKTGSLGEPRFFNDYR